MREKRIKKNIAKTLVTFIMLTCFIINPAANIIADAQTASEFSVQAIIPDNQIDTKQTYFDLRMEPGQEQTVQVLVRNPSKEDLTVNVQLNAASTGRNGLIVYSEPNIQDETMQVSITDIATLGHEKVTVPASGSSTVDINLKMPEERFDGVILGGIVITKADDNDNDNNGTGEGVSLNNKISYVIGLKLTENDEEIAPDFKLTSITPSLINYKTAVVATLQNYMPLIVKDMEVKAEVFKSGSDTVLHNLELNAAEMAPQSQGDFVIDWGSQEIDPGTYRLKMTADYGGRTWEWDEEFTVGNEANKLNNEAVGLDEAVGIGKNYTWLYLVIGLAAIIAIGFIVYWIGRRRIRDEK